MFTIILDRFADYNTKEIYTRLAGSGQTVFEIILPRMKQYDTGCIGYLMVVEYNEAMYCGQLLSGLGNGFVYRVPYKNSHHPFYFIISTGQIEQLAETLFHLASVYKENDIKRWDYYETEKNDFCFRCWNNLITPVCSGFLPVTALLLQEENLNRVKVPAKLPRSTAINRLSFAEFIGYTREDLFQYLQLMETRSFCLVLNRFNTEITYDAGTIARQFFHAAFVGEKIHAVCKSFSYLVPDAYSTVDFQFDVVTNNLQGLAGVLYEVVRLGEHTKEVHESYQHKMNIFGKSYSEGELDPVCQGLLDVFEEAAERAENNR